jgi:fatty-acyl-CoA synthase
MTSQQHQGPSLTALTLRALRRYPERTAFRWGDEALSYRAASDLISRVQHVLVEQGLRPGDRVAMLTSNRADAWCAGVAVQASGAVLTPLHPKGSLKDHLFQLENAQARVVITDSGAFAERGGELAQFGNTKVFTLGCAGYGADLLAAVQQVGSVTVRDLSLPEGIAVISYTGGTTGKPKGVVRSQRCLTAGANAILSDFELPRAPRYLAVAPISHVTGTNIVPTLIRGGTIHLLGSFDPEQTLRTIERERINFSLMVPTMLYSLLDSPLLSHTDLTSLELLLYGAAPMSPHRLSEGLERIGAVFSQLYGQSECYPIAVLSKADHDPLRPGLLSACGFPVSGSSVILLDEDGQAVAAGDSGEICVRGPQVMSQYWGDPDQTQEALRDGWLHTGDVARADEEGRLFIVDRKKDMIVTGGFNVYSREVEDVLTANPGVAMATVIGVPDAKWGEAVVALVVRRPGAIVSAETLIREVKECKGPVQAPKAIHFVDQLPTTSLGKVDKKALRTEYGTNETLGGN